MNLLLVAIGGFIGMGIGWVIIRSALWQKLFDRLMP